MSKAEFKHAQDLRLTFFELVEAGILNVKDKDRPLSDILQKLLEAEKDLEDQLEKSDQERSELESIIISSHSNHQQQLPPIKSSNNQKSLERKNSKDEKSKALREIEANKNEQKFQYNTKTSSQETKQGSFWGFFKSGNSQ